MSNHILKIQNISKTFRIPTENSLRSCFFNFNKNKKYREFKALKNISLRVKRGEWLGIIGKNGSGKSTLLKIIAGIYQSDSGRVLREGKIVPFLELGIGFNQELSARENIYLNGTILGITKKEIDKKFNDIVDFAEIKDFLDTPLKNFSSGMKVRLAFSIAIQVNADIYLLDEILAVGDFIFKKKCKEVFQKMQDSEKTVLFVSHSTDSIKKYCDNVLWLENGTVKHFGDNKTKIIEEYIKNK